MSHNNSQVAHLWANRSKPRARSSNGNFWFEGDTIYSYQTPIAKLHGNVALVTSNSYSVTTSGKHMPAIRRALSCRMFYVPSIGVHGMIQHAKNLKHFVDGFEDALAKARRTRDDYNFSWRCKLAQDIAQTMMDYATAFNLTDKAWREPCITVDAWIEQIQTERAAAQAKRNSPAQIAKREREAARHEAKRAEQARLAQAKEAERAAEWIAGHSNSYRTNYGTPAFLRVKGDVLETSQGADVPLDHAIKAFRLIFACRLVGKVWERNGDTIRVGHFQVDRIEANGDIKAGCHVILWPEIERIARQLELL